MKDSECNGCAGGQYWWPCNFETLCYCADYEEGSPRIPPAPKSRLQVNEGIDPCRDVLTEEVFNSVVQPATDEGRALFTYDGLCNAIHQYNMNHDEKFAQMGNDEQIRAEIAAFLAHTAADTNGYSTTREGLHCVEPITGSDGRVYCKPCKEAYYDAVTGTCSQNYFTDADSYNEYCDVTRQAPQGCTCDKESIEPVTVPRVDASQAFAFDAGGDQGPSSMFTGYIPASSAYFTRGALEISWNYDYYGASQSLTGDPDFLCDNPDFVSTRPEYAWGVGLYKWMEKMIFGTTGSTAHKQVLNGGNFGGTVKVLYGDLECPSNPNSSAKHVELVRDRVAQVCKAGAALGVFLEMDKCDNSRDCLECSGLKEIYESCQLDGSCPDCNTWTQFVRSSPPTVTPIRIGSPTWDDWATNYHNSRSAAEVNSPSLYTITWVLLATQWAFALC